jgi:hypothetical protein
MPVLFPCPRCGFDVFAEPPGSYEICPLCGWEDDHVQLRFPGLAGGANHGSLCETQAKVLKMLPLDLTQLRGYRRSPGWRPLRPEECQPDAAAPRDGMEYTRAAVQAPPPYYWQAER